MKCKVNYIEILNYFLVGVSILVTLIVFVGADRLWEKRFFNKSLISAIILGLFGVFFETIQLVHFKTGTTVVVMLIPLI